MSSVVAKRWSVDEFFAWQERQSDRYEFVGGAPVPMTTRQRNTHSLIVANVVAELGRQVRGSSRCAFTGDSSVETYHGQVRRPDAGVDCGRRDPNGFSAAEPRLVVEVLSPSTRDYDTFDKLAEYKSVETLDYILYVEPNTPDVSLWQRTDTRAWMREGIEGLDRVVAMPALGIELALAELYDGLDVPLTPAVEN